MTKTPAPERVSAVANENTDAIEVTAVVVAAVNRVSSCSSITVYGSGQAKSRNRIGSANGKMIRAPNNRTTDATATSGSVSRSIRAAQKYFDHAIGPTETSTTAASSSGTAST